MRFGNRVADVVARPVSRGVLSRGLGGRHGWAPCVFRGWGRARGARACVSRGASRGRGQRQTAVRQRSGANFWMHRYIRKLIGRRKGLALLETETVRVETGARALDRPPGRRSDPRRALERLSLRTRPRGRNGYDAHSRGRRRRSASAPRRDVRGARVGAGGASRVRAGTGFLPRADPVPRADRARLARVAPRLGIAFLLLALLLGGALVRAVVSARAGRARLFRPPPRVVHGRSRVRRRGARATQG